MKAKVAFVVALAFLMTSVLVGVGQAGEVYDFGGETVRIHADYGIPLFEEGEYLAWREEVEEMFNVNIEMKTGIREGHDVEPFVTSVMAGDPVVDVFVTQRRDWEPMTDVLFPITDFIDEEFWSKSLIPPEHIDDQLKQQNKLGGEYYSIPMVNNYDSFVGTWINPVAIAWNKDIFEAEGLPNLYDIVDAGEWTFDKLMELSKQVQRDTTGDGEIDQFPFGRFWTWATLSANNTDTPSPWIKTGETGRLEVNLDSPEMIEAMEWMHEYFHVEGMIDAGRDAFVDGNAAFMGENIDKVSWLLPDVEFEWGVVPWPMGPSADRHAFTAHRTNVLVFPVTHTYDKVEKLIALTNALLRNSTDWMDRDDFMEIVDQAYAPWVPDMETYQFFQDNVFAVRAWMFRGPVGGTMSEAVEDGDVTRIVEENMPEMQEALDEAVGQ